MNVINTSNQRNVKDSCEKINWEQRNTKQNLRNCKSTFMSFKLLLKDIFGSSVWFTEYFWAMSLRHADNTYNTLLIYKCFWTGFALFGGGKINGLNGIDNELCVCSFLGLFLELYFITITFALLEMVWRTFTQWNLCEIHKWAAHLHVPLTALFFDSAIFLLRLK